MSEIISLSALQLCLHRDETIITTYVTKYVRSNKEAQSSTYQRFPGVWFL